MYSQKDPRWADIKINIQTLGKVGCLITSLANIYESYHKVILTPVEMLERLKVHKGITRDDLVIWEAVYHALGCKKIDINYVGDITYGINCYYIVNYINYGTGHFTNLLERISENRLRVFDVYEGKQEIKRLKEIRRVVRIEF